MKAVAGIFVLLASSIATQTPPTVTPADARQLEGKVATVCAVVEHAGCVRGEGRSLTFGAESKFRVLMSPRVTERRVEERFVDRQICVTGRIDAGGPGHQIVVEDVAAIRVLAESRLRMFAPHAYRSGCENDFIDPRLRTEVKPAYTRKAMADGVEGRVLMEVVVEANGTVGDVWVLRSLRSDLDRQAMLAVKEWRFEPATLKGEPVATLVNVDMAFTLKTKP